MTFLAAKPVNYPPDGSSIYLRARSDFVVPRPSELHPHSRPPEAGERGYLLPLIRPAAATGEAKTGLGPGRRNARKRRGLTIGPREIVALIVVAAAACTGAMIAMLSGQL